MLVKFVDDIEGGNIKQEYKNYSNNVHTFCIPTVNENIYEKDCISVEHCFRKEDLCKKEEGRKRFFWWEGSEFLGSEKYV
jgi:hypothetical protein